MPEPWQQQEWPAAPQQVVGEAIRDLVAARLGRGFIPLALLFVTGLAQSFTLGLASPDALTLSLGAVAAGCAMLAYGLRVVQRALDRPHRQWMSLAMLGSLVPPAFALYVFGWRGLRLLAGGGGLSGVGLALLFAGMGVWVMRTWMRVVEVERLARAMTLDADEEVGRT